MQRYHIDYQKITGMKAHETKAISKMRSWTPAGFFETTKNEKRNQCSIDWFVRSNWLSKKK